MESSKIRLRFLKFFENRGHKIIPSSSLVPHNDSSVLFNTAGMQPLVPYLMGQKHPMGKRIVNVQKCVRTQDIDEVGDNTHDTFFEMMGNWSLGDYFKEDAIEWSYEFLTSKEEGLGLDSNRLYITVFEGDENAPKDRQAFNIWKKYIKENHIYYMGAKTNWWSVGENGPCGPDTEMFYDITKEGLGDLNKEEYIQADKEQKVVEIWNDVFMQYLKKDGKVVGQLPSKNVDTGSGLERVVMVVQGKDNIFETDLFESMMSRIKKTSSDTNNFRSHRIIADHVRTSVFMIAAGVVPSNTDRGYILRRLLRRAIIQCKKIKLPSGEFLSLVDDVITKYSPVYSEDLLNKNFEIKLTIENEIKQFERTLDTGLKEFEKGTDPFILFTTFGFPIEVTLELTKEKGKTINLEDFNKKMAEHQKFSQTASVGMFKGGLANNNEKTVKLHTAHHLLLAALKIIIGPDVKQRGSNITEERLRIDFLCDHKLTDEEKKNIEYWVNDKIKQGLNVVRKEMPFEKAEKIGAEMEFGAKYTDIVSVYFIEDKVGNIVSKEFCGGPHVKNTTELYSLPQAESKNNGPFKIQKEESVAQGIRRIKAVLL